MKILFIEPCYQNFGGYYRSSQICQSLSKQKIKVDLLFSSNKKFFIKLQKKTINQNYHQYVLPRFYFNFFINGRIIRGLLAIIIGLIGNYDIIHASSTVQLESNIPLTFFRLMGKKTVMSWEDIWSNCTIQGRILNHYLSFWEKFSPRFFKNVVAISNIIQKRAIKLKAQNTIKLINGTDPSYPCPNQKTSLHRLKLNRNFRYLFTFGNSFGLDRNYLLLKYFQYLIKIDKNIRLITNFDSQSQLQSHRHKNKIDPRVFDFIINAGYIKETLLPYYFAASEAVVLILGNTLNEKSCYPVRIGKFISSQKPIIINNNNSETNHVLSQFHCSISSGSLKKLAQKTVNTINNPSQKNTLVKNTILAKKALSWNNLTTSLISFYQKI